MATKTRLGGAKARYGEAKARLPVEMFDIPVHKIRRGYYSAVYFWREKQILEILNFSKTVLMQVFQKRAAVLCGTDEALAVLKTCNGYYRNPEQSYKLFDRYLVLNRKIRGLSAIVRNEETTLLLRGCFNEKLDLEIQLDSLWENAVNRLEIFSLYDGC